MTIKLYYDGSLTYAEL